MFSELGTREALALGQGFYFFVTGLWAIVHIRSFLAVTGPKTDIWLVKTVGAMITVVGVALLLAGWNARVTPEVEMLAIASAAALCFVDCYYAATNTIPRIYLLDAAVEMLIIASWLAAMIFRV